MQVHVVVIAISVIGILFLILLLFSCSWWLRKDRNAKNVNPKLSDMEAGSKWRDSGDNASFVSGSKSQIPSNSTYTSPPPQSYTRGPGQQRLGGQFPPSRSRTYPMPTPTFSASAATYNGGIPLESGIAIPFASRPRAVDHLPLYAPTPPSFANSSRRTASGRPIPNARSVHPPPRAPVSRLPPGAARPGMAQYPTAHIVSPPRRAYTG